MALFATLHDHRRSAARQALDVDATLRVDGRPLDALIANISASGCLFVCSEPLEVGDTVTIGIAGIARRRMQIVRALHSRYGAEFEAPLNQGEIDAAMAVPGQIVAFPKPMGLQSAGDEDRPIAAKLHRPMRLVIVAGLTAATWCALIPLLRAGWMMIR